MQERLRHACTFCFGISARSLAHGHALPISNTATAPRYCHPAASEINCRTERAVLRPRRVGILAQPDGSDQLLGAATQTMTRRGPAVESRRIAHAV